jgi:hypothetical protein
MRTRDVIRLEGVEHDVEVRRHRHTRNLAHSLGDGASRGLSWALPFVFGAEVARRGKALMSAVAVADLARGPRPQEGAAYG